MHFSAMNSNEYHWAWLKPSASFTFFKWYRQQSRSLLYFTNYLAVIFMKYKAKNVCEVMGLDQTLARLRTERSRYFPIQKCAQRETGLLSGTAESFSTRLCLARVLWRSAVTGRVKEAVAIDFCFSVRLRRSDSQVNLSWNKRGPCISNANDPIRQTRLVLCFTSNSPSCFMPNFWCCAVFLEIPVFVCAL